MWTDTKLYVFETFLGPLRRYFPLVLLFIVNNNIQRMDSQLVCLGCFSFKLWLEIRTLKLSGAKSLSISPVLKRFKKKKNRRNTHLHFISRSKWEKNTPTPNNTTQNMLCRWIPSSRMERKTPKLLFKTRHKQKQSCPMASRANKVLSLWIYWGLGTNWQGSAKVFSP